MKIDTMTALSLLACFLGGVMAAALFDLLEWLL